MNNDNGITSGLRISKREVTGNDYISTAVLDQNDPVPSPTALAHLVQVVLDTSSPFTGLTYSRANHTLRLRHDSRLHEAEVKRWVATILRNHSEPATAAGVRIVRAPRRYTQAQHA